MQKKENILHRLWPEAQHDGKALPCPCGPRSSRLPFFSKTTTEGKAKARYKMENPAHSQSVHITKVFFPPVSRKLQRCKANWEPLTGSLGTEIIRAELQRSPPPLLRGFKFACILKGAALICQGCLGPSPGRPRPEQLLSREEGGGVRHTTGVYRHKTRQAPFPWGALCLPITRHGCISGWEACVRLSAYVLVFAALDTWALGRTPVSSKSLFVQAFMTRESNGL